MALVIPLGYAHVVHSLTLSGDTEPMAMTYGVDALPGFTATEIAIELDGFFDTLMGSFSNQYTLTNTEVTLQDVAPPAPPSLGSKANSQVGAGTDPVVPQNTAFLIHKRSGVGGRGGRGRMYQPGVGEGQVNTVGQLTGAIVTALNTAYATFLTSINNGTKVAGMVILHDSTGAHAADDPREVTSLTVDPVVSTQRRRLRR